MTKAVPQQTLLQRIEQAFERVTGFNVSALAHVAAEALGPMAMMVNPTASFILNEVNKGLLKPKDPNDARGMASALAFCAVLRACPPDMHLKDFLKQHGGGNLQSALQDALHDMFGPNVTENALMGRLGISRPAPAVVPAPVAPPPERRAEAPVRPAPVRAKPPETPSRPSPQADTADDEPPAAMAQAAATPAESPEERQARMQVMRTSAADAAIVLRNMSDQRIITALDKLGDNDGKLDIEEVYAFQKLTGKDAQKVKDIAAVLQPTGTRVENTPAPEGENIRVASTPGERPQGRGNGLIPL